MFYECEIKAEDFFGLAVHTMKIAPITDRKEQVEQRTVAVHDDRPGHLFVLRRNIAQFSKETCRGSRVSPIVIPLVHAPENGCFTYFVGTEACSSRKSRSPIPAASKAAVPKIVSAIGKPVTNKP